jgi:enamine deaminase RidA (YjgF/YER057c/UK114 family)
VGAPATAPAPSKHRTGSTAPKVSNGCSGLLVEVSGDAGRHARSAVGMSSPPNRMTAEVEAVLQVRR